MSLKPILIKIDSYSAKIKHYVSTSCIIGDYIKPYNIQKMIKIVSLKSHIAACIGFLYFINYKK